jgi:hypothetical protein
MVPTAVRTPRTAHDFALGVELASMQAKAISPVEVARVLRQAGVNHVIVGAHAANGYTGKPRATVDVDVIVQHPKKAAAAVAAAFPSLHMHDLPVVTRFMRDDIEAIDLMKPVGSPLWPRLLKENRQVLIDGENITIPTLEGALAAKFAAMMSLNRKMLDKQQDGIDFARMIEANAEVNLGSVAELAELVFAGGGAFILKLIEDARAGRRLEF